MNIKEQLIQKNQGFPDKTAFIFEDSPVNFSLLQDKTFCWANYLVSLGVKKGDKVAVYLPNIPEAIYGLLGALSVGATIVPLDFMLTEEEIMTFVNHSQVSVLLCQQKKGLDLGVIKKRCPELKEIITCREKIEGFHFWDDVISKSPCDEPEIDSGESDLSSIFYTSGSTGHPKGVMLNFSHFDNPVKTLDHFLRVSKDDVFLCGGVPFSHLGGFGYILLMVYFGSTLMLMERFQPFEFLKNIQKHNVTIFCIVPAMFMAILAMKEYDKFDFSSLRYAVVFGAPSSPVILKRFKNAYPNAKLLNGWGMTETAAPNTLSPCDLDLVKSIGRFSPLVEVKIVDEQGKTLEQGSQGELWIKGPVMAGYYKEEELTKAVLTDDGWLKTGDIATCDEDGFYYIVGRKKDMIKVAGEIVFPDEVEEKMQRFPAISEVAVIGIEDKMRGEVPKAFIVTKDDQQFDEDKLRIFLKEHLAHFKIPHYFEVVKELPKNRTGKIDKQLLKQRSSS